MHCPTALGLWAVVLLLHTALLGKGSGHALLPGAVAPGLLLCTTSLPAFQRWVVELLQCTASSPRGSGQWISFCTLPQGIGAMGSGTPSVHCYTAMEQLVEFVAGLLLHTATLLGSRGRWEALCTPPHYLGAVGHGKFLLIPCLTLCSIGQRDSFNTQPH